MEISFVIEWASVLVGFVLGLLTFFAGALVIAYRMKKSELSDVYKASGKQKK